jgi:NADH-quinone oxidoreductase subunit M
MPIVTVTIFAPLVGGILLALLPRENERGIQRAALAFGLVPFVLSLLMLFELQPGEAGFPRGLEEQVAWIPSWGISYHVGVDGISLFLVLLTTFLTPLVILASWGEVKRAKEYFVLFLFLETGMLGALVALDVFLFYVFWEVMLIPMYLLIGVWGGPRRIYAATKFVLYTVVGSLPMLVAVLYCAWRTKAGAGTMSFDYERFLQLSLTPSEQLWCFAAFALAFAIKVPLFPVHTWLPDAHTEAPTGGSVILAGVLLKMGTYGLLRFAMPLFPYAVHELGPVLVGLAVIGIVYGALVAVVQADVKRLVAYSSVSHLGFCVLGLFGLTTTAVAGSVYQMLNHGVSTGGLFLLVGMIYERRHTRQISAFGGLWKIVPMYSAALMLVMLASAGLPGLNGFVGEFLILAGSFPTWQWPTAIATSGLVLGALYLLWMYQRVIFGPVTHEENRTLTDLTARELVVITPIIALCFVMGLHPTPFLRRIEPSVKRIVERVQSGHGTAVAQAQSPVVSPVVTP